MSRFHACVAGAATASGGTARSTTDPALHLGDDRPRFHRFFEVRGEPDLGRSLAIVGQRMRCQRYDVNAPDLVFTPDAARRHPAVDLLTAYHTQDHILTR